MSDFQTGTPANHRAEGRPQAHFTAALLQATLNTRRIVAMVALAYDSPQVLTYSCSLGLGEDPARVERLAGALALARGRNPAAWPATAGRLVIEVPRRPEDRKPLRATRLDTLTAAARGRSLSACRAGARPCGWI